MKRIPLTFFLGLAALVSVQAAPENAVLLNLAPTAEHPRNSEGAFAVLHSGRILFAYSQFYGGGEDASPARIAEVHSDDRGRTWSQPAIMVENGANLNVMSVSFLRLRSGKLAMFYAVKKTEFDCRPYMRISSDEGATWSPSKPVFRAPGYFVINNDRIVQLATGRLIVPVAQHRWRSSVASEPKAFDHRGSVFWYLSDDEGATWREADTWWTLAGADPGGLQEPGVIELADGTLFSWARTLDGCQYSFRSHDHGVNWSAPEPTELKSPCSPASVKRLPHSDDILAIYNDHSGMASSTIGDNAWHHRTPLVATISHDGGKTWGKRKTIEGDPRGEYCYTAIEFLDHAVLLGYLYYGRAETPSDELDGSRIRRIDLSWFDDIR